jgi:hypothetical protein
MLTNNQKSQNHYDSFVLQIVLQLSGNAAHGFGLVFIEKQPVSSCFSHCVISAICQTRPSGFLHSTVKYKQTFLVEGVADFLLKNFEFVADNLPTDR